MKSPILIFTLLLALLLPPPLQSSTTSPSVFKSSEISDIEIDINRGYLFFKAGTQNLWWYASGERHERIKTGISVGAQLQTCESIEVSWTREESQKRDGIVHDFVSSLIIKLPSPAK